MNTKNVTAKNINAKSDKKAQAAIAKAFSLLDGKQGYRLFKSVDLNAYRAQGQHTICALRKVEFGKGEGQINGSTVFFTDKGAQGCATFKGAKLDSGKLGHSGKVLAQAGNFVLNVSNWREFTTEADFVKFIVKTGQKVNGQLDASKKRFTHAVGLGKKYAFATDGKQLFRLEDIRRSGGDKRGTAYEYTLGAAK